MYSRKPKTIIATYIYTWLKQSRHVSSRTRDNTIPVAPSCLTGCLERNNKTLGRKQPYAGSAGLAATYHSVDTSIYKLKLTDSAIFPVTSCLVTAPLTARAISRKGASVIPVHTSAFIHPTLSDSTSTRTQIKLMSDAKSSI